ncbi:phosphate ABC transporter ATP-binding protein [Clostridium magnum]|uniref:Phosphate import ATP-binding protein PstB 3 n=1 Tax=Clostridium magnum DSM 2767 TaxID=1121326 RepID=A0A162T500_9CLOT|nr:phosphate ABC transporter ATP-binding protein [Clostridium magnum]KZL92250.1 phosphate import ATP-binding protein PstB 3 [Clostridium magnum DSM 2767]SHH16209.1 phosphate ABC transporter ATP-binding protein, PhoT family (TC 3.A.1.7.1) [Clostridium magnum DSM 2767]
MDNILEIRNLQVYLDNKPILKEVNLSIKKGKITAIIGPSGCGKSTLLKSINRIIEEEKNSKVHGSILLKGEDIKSINKEHIRKNIGCVFQIPAPFPFSIYKNMIYALKYYGIKDRAKLNNIVEKNLKMVGLYEEIKDNLNISALKLSGGQQQRLCIARTLTVEPEIILMDEPCSALDLNNTIKIEETLKKLSDNYTIIIVTHNLAQARRISNYTAFMLNGQIEEYDETKKLFTNPIKESTRKYISGLFG